MALDYHTGFDMLAAGASGSVLLQMGWTHATGGTVYASGAGAVRTGARSLFLTFTHTVGMANLANAATRVLGFGLYLGGLNGSSYGIASVADGGITPSNAQVGLAMDGTGHLQVFRGLAVATTGGTLLGTSTNALVASTWHFVELVVTVHASAGAVEVYVNGSKTGWIDLSGINTQGTANAYSNTIAFGGIFPETVIDDVYTATTRLGECKSVVKLAGTDAALGAGAYAQSTPSTGTDRGAMVDEAQPDDDTTYNALTAAAQKDAYKTVPLGLPGLVIGATVRARMKKSDAGAASAQVGLRSGSVDDVSADVFPSDTSYAWFSRVYPTDPNTGAAWTIPNLDAAQILVKRTL